jgi:hypothetical protein
MRLLARFETASTKERLAFLIQLAILAVAGVTLYLQWLEWLRFRPGGPCPKNVDPFER